MNKLTNDLCAITSISKLALDNLVDKSITCICHSVQENILSKDPLTCIDIGIGTLYIKFEGNEVKYKLIPSKKLEESVSFTLLNKQSPLVYSLETALKDRIENAYKELL